MKLTDEQIASLFGGDYHYTEVAKIVEAEVLRLNGISEDGMGEAVAPYGYCPICGAKGEMRERRPDGYDTCANGHNYKSATALATPPQQQQAAPGAVLDGWISVEQQMPKSGQIVLALQKWDHSGKLGIIRAAWIAAKTEESSPESDIGEYDEATDTYYDPEGWYEQISHWDDYAAVFVNGATIVAWMPLPAAMLSAAPKPSHVQDGWQPIETAPNDGTMFICWVSAVRYGETDEGQQYQQDASQPDFCWWRDGLDGNGYFDPACGQIGDSQDVTHWMPLPAAPKPQEPGA